MSGRLLTESFLFVRSPSARRREQQEDRARYEAQISFSSSTTENTTQSMSQMEGGFQSEVRENSWQGSTTHSNECFGEGSLLVSMYNAAEEGRTRDSTVSFAEEGGRNGNRLSEPVNRKRHVACSGLDSIFVLTRIYEQQQRCKCIEG
jgi:hypothetical protein